MPLLIGLSLGYFMVLLFADALAVTQAGLFVFGVGVSFALPALVAGVAGAVPVELAGTGADALNSARQVGASLGVAVLGVILGQSGIRSALLTAGVVLLAGAVIVAQGRWISHASEPGQRRTTG